MTKLTQSAVNQWLATVTPPATLRDTEAPHLILRARGQSRNWYAYVSIGGRAHAPTRRLIGPAAKIPLSTARIKCSSIVTELRAKVGQLPTHRITIAACWAAYQAHRLPDLRPSTRLWYDSLWRHHLAPTYANSLLATLTPAGISAWYTAQRQTHPTRAAAAIALLRAIIGASRIYLNYSGPNPAQALRLSLIHISEPTRPY